MEVTQSRTRRVNKLVVEDTRAKESSTKDPSMTGILTKPSAKKIKEKILNVEKQNPPKRNDKPPDKNVNIMEEIRKRLPDNNLDDFDERVIIFMSDTGGEARTTTIYSKLLVDLPQLQLNHLNETLYKLLVLDVLLQISKDPPIWKLHIPVRVDNVVPEIVVANKKLITAVFVDLMSIRVHELAPIVKYTNSYKTIYSFVDFENDNDITGYIKLMEEMNKKRENSMKLFFPQKSKTRGASLMMMAFKIGTLICRARKDHISLTIIVVSKNKQLSGLIDMFDISTECKYTNSRLFIYEEPRACLNFVEE